MHTSENHHNIILCGFTSSGKTTIGRPLARALGCDFVDTDQLLTGRCGMSIPELIARDGAERFRELEHEITLEAAAMTGTVISTGGGLMTYEHNAAPLAASGTVIYLAPDFELCYRRLSAHPERPIMQKNTKEQLHRLFDSRIPSYKKYASLTLVNPTNIKEAVADILDFLNQQC